MTFISKATYMDYVNFNKRVQDFLKVGFPTLEEASQRMADALYEEYKDSVVLVRIFGTVPFSGLPETGKKFVKNLAVEKGVSALLNDNVPVLSLLGSRGEDQSWNSRHSSKGHVGIPLVSADFIELIPMMSRLLKSLGGSLEWISSGDLSMISNTLANLSGLFYVEDARTALDDKGRHIIAAQDFVEKYNVKTTFGFGGGYVISMNSIVFIIFTRETVEKEKAESFLSLASIFKAATIPLVADGKIFKT